MKKHILTLVYVVITFIMLFEIQQLQSSCSVQEKLGMQEQTQVAQTQVVERAHITLLTLQTIVTEVEAVLNDRPLTHISDDITDPQPLMPAHLLHSRRIIKLLHQPATMEELQDPDSSIAERVRRDAKIQSILLEAQIPYIYERVLPSFWNKWSTNQCWRCCVGPQQLSSI